MCEVMAVAGVVWSGPYAWKGPVLVVLRKGNKWPRERNRSGEKTMERVCDITPPLKESRPRDLICLLGLGLVGFAKWYSWTTS